MVGQRSAAVLAATVVALTATAAAPRPTAAGPPKPWSVTPLKIVARGSLLPGVPMPPVKNPTSPGLFIQPAWRAEVFSTSTATLTARVAQPDYRKLDQQLTSAALVTNFARNRLLFVAVGWAQDCCALAAVALTSTRTDARLILHVDAPPCPLSPDGTGCTSGQAFVNLWIILRVPRRLFPVPHQFALSIRKAT